MPFVNDLLLIGALPMCVGIMPGASSSRRSVPFLRVFLAVGNLAPAIILLDGGLRTKLSTFRVALRPSRVPATVGQIALPFGPGTVLGIGLGRAPAWAGRHGLAGESSGCCPRRSPACRGRPAWRCWSRPKPEPTTCPGCSRAWTSPRVKGRDAHSP